MKRLSSKVSMTVFTATAALSVAFVAITDAIFMESRAAQERYLQKFNHMGNYNPDPLLAEIRMSDANEEFRMAIMSFQRFAGLNMTGEADNATVAMMKMQRCGVADHMENSMGGVARRRRRRRYTLSGHKWWKNSITYRFVNYSNDLKPDDVKRQFEKAFKMWSDVTPLKFYDVTNIRNRTADIDILFASCDEHGDEYPFDGPGGVLAHAFFPGVGLSGDVHFDEHERFTQGMTTSGFSLLQVAIHELGHSLGLTHSDNKDAIMTPFYRKGIPEANLKLHMDDVNGIQRIYGPKPPPTTTPITTTTMASTTTTRSTISQKELLKLCENVHFDAIDVINGTIHAFFGNQYAQLNDDGTVRSGFPKLINETFPNLPNNLDAVVNMEQEAQKVLFFKGSDCYQYNSRSTATEKLQRLTISQCLNLHPDSRTLTHVDAAFAWSGNGHIFLVHGINYHRYAILPTYGNGWIYNPRPLSEWKNLPVSINDAFNHRKLHKTYFFSGPKHYIIDDMQFAVQSDGDNDDWLRCCNYRISELESALANSAIVNALQAGEVSMTSVTATPSQSLCVAAALLTLVLSAVIVD